MMREWPKVGEREKSGMYYYEAVHQQSRSDGGRREGGGGYMAVARFTRGWGGQICVNEYIVYFEIPYSNCRQIVLLNSQ